MDDFDMDNLLDWQQKWLTRSSRPNQIPNWNINIDMEDAVRYPNGDPVLVLKQDQYNHIFRLPYDLISLNTHLKMEELVDFEGGKCLLEEEETFEFNEFEFQMFYNENYTNAEPNIQSKTSYVWS
jgi:hypothetical protein|tara:strand:- start:444 stop:818 length:375 start_codon:yes stop_codon:yes gene_type:complete